LLALFFLLLGHEKTMLCRIRRLVGIVGIDLLPISRWFFFACLDPAFRILPVTGNHPDYSKENH